MRQAVRRAFEAVGETGSITTPCPGAKAILLRENVSATVDEWREWR